MRHFLLTLTRTPIGDSRKFILSAKDMVTAFDMAKKRFPVSDRQSFRIQEISKEQYLSTLSAKQNTR